MKLWAGRFKKDADGDLNDFNSSIAFDQRMYREDIEGSIAHARMLGKTGIIGEDAAAQMVAGLAGILADIESGALVISPDAEDIHTFVEQELSARIGENGKRLHTARSRNDQVALDIRMYLKKETKELLSGLYGLLAVLRRLAAEHKDAILPGYTHLQRAQPVCFSHCLLAYAQMFMRDTGRLRDAYRRGDVMPLGSGALAGTTHPIDREFVARQLGFPAVTENSMDGVSDRDFVLELSAALCVMMTHLSRFAEEIILWCSAEFSFLELDDAFSTGSSIMPQKKNPDIAELVRGKTGRVYGNNTTLLTVMKGLPLAYNKDMQEDKEAIFDSVDTAKLCLRLFAKMLDSITVKKDSMRRAASRGLINATDCADYLVTKGMPFRSAYQITGELVAYCIEREKTLEELAVAEYRAFSEVFDEGVFEAIRLENCVARRDCRGGPGPSSIKAQLAALTRFLREHGKSERKE